MRKRASLSFALVAVAAIAGCSSTRNTGQIEKVTSPEFPNVSYRVVKNVDSKGSASAFSPGFSWWTMSGAVASANEDAVGKAIFEDNAIDAVIAPKTRVETLNVLFFGFADVHLKGKGVEITGPK